MNAEIESLMAEQAAAMKNAAENKNEEAEIDDVEMANRLSKTIARNGTCWKPFKK